MGKGRGFFYNICNPHIATTSYPIKRARCQRYPRVKFAKKINPTKLAGDRFMTISNLSSPAYSICRPNHCQDPSDHNITYFKKGGEKLLQNPPKATPIAGPSISSKTLIFL